MKAARTSLAALALMIFASASFAAPKIDSALRSRLKVAQPGVQLGVILTFYGDKVTDSQIAAVRGLGITTGVRMRNFPIVAVNATPVQIQQMSKLEPVALDLSQCAGPALSSSDEAFDRS